MQKCHLQSEKIVMFGNLKNMIKMDCNFALLPNSQYQNIPKLLFLSVLFLVYPYVLSVVL